MRTGGSTGLIPRHNASKLPEGDGYFWDLTRKKRNNDFRLPVKYRYRSPVVFEFFSAGHRKPDAWAIIWLQHLMDNQETPINVPIWRTANPARITQNYITEENCHDEPGLEDLQELGRLQFRAKFSAGMDESHEAFVVDNNTRETFETWEACFSEGVRHRHVEKETPERIQELHEKSLTEGRDVLQQADDEEKQKWLGKEGTDWSGAFGHDPAAYVDGRGRKRREPGKDAPLHDPYHPSSDDDDDDDDDASSDDLGIQDATNTSGGAAMNGQAEGGGGGAGQAKNGHDGVDGGRSLELENKRAEERKHRGLMQWRPARNARFAKDQSKIGFRKLKSKLTGGLEGRKPTVETGTFMPIPLCVTFARYGAAQCLRLLEVDCCSVEPMLTFATTETGT